MIGHFAGGWAVMLMVATAVFMRGEHSALIASIVHALMWALWPASTWVSSEVGIGWITLAKAVESMLFAALVIWLRFRFRPA
jgi:hypothetical protein